MARAVLSRPGVTAAIPMRSSRPSQTPHPVEHGRRVAERYVVGRPMAQGAWARILEAWDERLHRSVALKVLVTDDPEAQRRFEREARLAANIRHANVLDVYDQGQLEDGRRFMVMERLEGEDLASRLERGLPSIEEVVDLGRQLAMALSALESHEVVHRDVKPQNVVLHHDRGETIVKLVDFGVSKGGATLQPETTDGGVIVGTPYYLSPEQVQGTPVDTRSDLFSLGIVLYETLTGHHPFVGDSVGAVAAAILEQPVPPVLEQRPECPRSLARLVERLLARDPDERPAHASEVERELVRIAEELDLPLGADAWKPVEPSAPGPQAAPDTSQRSRRWAWAALVALLLIAGATAWGWIGPW